MKAFEYGGGRITLSIPSDWREKLEDDDVRLYYQDTPRSGEFRVRVKSFTSRVSQQVSAETVAGLLLGMAAEVAPDNEHEVTELPDGNLLVRFVRSILEDDPPIIMATWLVGIAVPPHGVQLASFTYTVLAQHVKSPEVAEQMELLEQCVFGAKYETALEESEPPRKKAWWRRGR